MSVGVKGTFADTPVRFWRCHQWAGYSSLSHLCVSAQRLVPSAQSMLNLTKRICVVPQRRRQSAIIYCGNAIIPTWSEGGPQSRQRGIGDGDDGSGPHSLAGRMAPIVKCSMRRCSTNVLRYQWASLSASRSDLGSRNFHTHKFLIALEWVEEPRWPEPYSG